MEQVVERGTARAAQIDGYTIAGKTGTAAKLVNGHYQKSDYNASFVGFMPSRKPALTILVVIDSPHGNGYTGGAVSAPVFKRIAEAALTYLGVGPNLNAPPPVWWPGTIRRASERRHAAAGARRQPAVGDARARAQRPDAGSARPQRARRAAAAVADRHDGAAVRRRLRRRPEPRGRARRSCAATPAR